MIGSCSWDIARAAIGCLLIGICCRAVCAEPSAENNRAAEDQEAILDTIAQINHINWVVNTIKTYNNAVVLEEEYEKISPGNLNLNRIPDEETLGRITKMLDTLYSLRQSDRNMRYWRRNFNESRSRKLNTFGIKASKQASDALFSQARACCSLWNWANNPFGSLAAVVQTVWNISHNSVSLYDDYENFVRELDQTADAKKFAFDTAKMDLLHQQNKELLQDQWRLMRRYHLDDRLRVSDVDVKVLLSALKDDSHARIYNRLLPMKDRFCLFPEYWYYLSCASLETGHFKTGLEACDMFFKVNRGIFRDDPMAGIVALNKAFMLEKTEANKPEIRRCLEIAWKSNAMRGDWQISYLAAIMYQGVFSEKDKAEMMLENAITLIESADWKCRQAGSNVVGSYSEGVLNCRNALRRLHGEPEYARYCVVDLSGGPMADSYPVICLDEEPSGGFNAPLCFNAPQYQYKTKKLVLKRVDPGTFIMGGDQTNEMHRVTLTKPFYMGLFEVTQKQWELVMGSNPCASSSYGSGDAYPVHYVSYDKIRGPVVNRQMEDNRGLPVSIVIDSASFIGRLRAKAKLDFDLPTCAQWEYACRAGTTTKYSYGNNKDGAYMWYGKNASSSSHMVGTRRPNKWGFYDMHGNVFEWCLCYFDFDSEAASYGIDPKGSTPISVGGSWQDGGGFWLDDDTECGSFSYSVLSVALLLNDPNFAEYKGIDNYKDLGFRISMTLP